MADRGIEVVRAHLAKLPPADSLTIDERRAQYERAEKVFPIPPEVKVERVSAPVAPAEWLRPPGAMAGRVVLYLHGGGYVIGSPRSHRHLAAAIATAGQAAALLLDYRLAPEHPYPAAVDDAAAAYRWLLDQGIAPGQIVIAGDSAGGGLTVATLLALRGARLPRRCRAADAAGLPALRRPARPAAAAHPRGQRRGAAGRLDPAGRPGAGRGRGRDARGVGSHDPRLALVPADARRGGDRGRRHRPLHPDAGRLAGRRRGGRALHLAVRLAVVAAQVVQMPPPAVPLALRPLLGRRVERRYRGGRRRTGGEPGEGQADADGEN